MINPESRALRPPRRSIERRAIRMWSAHASVFSLPPILALATLLLLIPPARLWLAPGLVVALVAGFVFVVLMPRGRYAVHRWEVTEEAVYTLSGWLWRRWRIAPLSRIQTVDSLRGPFHRMFGLAGVTVTTASAAGAIKIKGLDARIAEGLVDELAKAVHHIPEDAT
jgi:membrane protein YdbS with pleckstrin-like domain